MGIQGLGGMRDSGSPQKQLRSIWTSVDSQLRARCGRHIGKESLMILSPSIGGRRDGRGEGGKGFLLPIWHLEGPGLSGADALRGEGLGVDFGSEVSLHPALAQPLVVPRRLIGVTILGLARRLGRPSPVLRP